MTRADWWNNPAPGDTAKAEAFLDDLFNEEITMTSTETTTRPETYTQGLGEIIRAHRLYVGLSQRAMAHRLGKDRRDYQRIESGRDACPPGFLSEVETLSDQFDVAVDSLIEHARQFDGATFSYAEGQEWERNVAGRAALLAAADENPVTISLTLSGNNERGAG